MTKEHPSASNVPISSVRRAIKGPKPGIEQ